MGALWEHYGIMHILANKKQKKNSEKRGGFS